MNEGVEKVNPDMWKNFISHVMQEEEKAWNLDNIIDDSVTAESQPCVLTIGNSDSDDSDDNDDDGDFRYLSDSE